MSYIFGGGKKSNTNTVGGEGAAQLERIRPEDIVKQGVLFKQSRYWKEWRERYCVLTKTHLLSFKEKVTNGNYDNPTEVIPMTSCQTVKSSEDETNKPDTFVRLILVTTLYRNW